MADDRDDGGRFSEQYPDEAFVEAVRTLDVASTSNVADRVGCSYDLAYRRLGELESAGDVRSESVGRSFVWVAGEQ
jgi:GTP-sensing pleiotropic transcriptional regulator CodY